MRVRRHLIISGTGRAGTTALVQILTHLGLDTGYTPDTCRHIDRNSRAGLEKWIEADDAPYIIKSPHLCDTLGEVLAARPDIRIDTAIVPIRNLKDAADSRVFNARRMPFREPSRVMGGLFGTTNADEQEAVLTRKLYQLLLVLTEHDIPVLLLHHPRFLEDVRYLSAKLRLLFPGVRLENVIAAHAAVYDPTAGFRKHAAPPPSE